MSWKRQQQMIEESNYRNDPRVRGGEDKWWDSFDEKRMIALFGTTDEHEDPKTGEWVEIETSLEVRMKYVVCSVCNGKGTHVNPSIDAGGISFGGDFDGDPWEEDEIEGYMSGRYDVTCYTCGGKRVEPVLDTDNNSKEVIKAIDDHLNGLAEDWAEREAERRMGC